VPLFIQTVRCLDATRSIRGLIVVTPPGSVKRVSRLLARFRIKKVLATVPGGKERQESVWLGLQAVPHETEIVLVHDAVRPCVTPTLVESVIREAERFDAATCGLPARETVKRVKDGWVEETLSREGLWLTQTPQAFHRSLLWKAHEKARGDGFCGTDDAVLVERLGVNVRMVRGLQENIKITTREDLAFAQRLLKARGR
jgi:2-C-methyl-D-erythritol 4-phosphate cytidylyltransferase